MAGKNVEAAALNFAVRGVTATVKFAYNADLTEFSREVYGRDADAYTMEKFKAMQANLGHYIGSLDEAHREAFVSAALRRLAIKG